MLKKILLTFGLALSGFLLFVAFQPAASTISRELLIKATPEELFPYLNNSKKMNDWMPWKEEDPGVNMQYSGPDEGIGSVASWDSTGKMGTGQAVIIESKLNQSVKTQLTYTKPMEMSQIAEMILTPAEGGTMVKWSVDGHNGFFFRLMGILMNIEKMVGGQFEKGLTNLKTMAEAKP